MKIVIDARIIYTTTGRYVERLLHYLQEIDHNNEYIILLDTKDYDRWIPTANNFHKQRISIPNYSVREQLHYAWLLYRLKADLVHFAMPQQPLLYFGRSVTTIHDLTLLHHKNYVENKKIVYDIKQAIFRLVAYVATHKSTRVVVPTDYVKQDVVGSLHARVDKITVTHESADPIRQASEAPVKQLGEAPFIMYVGRMDPYKNIRRLIQTHQELLKSQPNLQLALPGPKDGNVESLQAWCAQEKYKQVHFLGFVSDEQLRWLFEHARAYIFPSLSEGFGLPGLEAMTYGTPLVSSNATCLPEVYKNGAQYFDPNSVVDMTTKIQNVLTDKKLRTALVARGHKVAQSYSWKRMSEQTLAVYRDALKKG